MYCVLLMIINKGLYGNELLTVNMKIVLEIMVDKYVYCILFKYVLDLPYVSSCT